MQSLQHNAIAPSTRRTYSAGIRHFKAFCARYGLASLPASELTIRFFCTEQSAIVSYSTISVYVPAIHMFHLDNGFADPTAGSVQLSLLLQGIKRAWAPSVQSRKPITTDMLSLLKSTLKSQDLPRSHYLLYWAAFTVAFYGFLRVGEYTAPSRCSTNGRTLRVQQVRVSKTSISIGLPSSKTCQFSLPAPIHMGATASSTCPVSTMRRFLKCRISSPSAPLFTFPDDSFLTPRQVSNMLKKILQQAGFDPALYSSHSVRIGAATSAAASGLPDHLVQKLGRWTSNAYKSYIRPQPGLLHASTVTISRDH